MVTDVENRLWQLIDGDHGAAAWLYDTFAPGLYRRLRRRYAHLQGVDANDLLHDAFVLFFQNRGKVLGDFLGRVLPRDQTERALERHLWDLACGVASNRRRSIGKRKTVSIDELRDASTDPNQEQTALGRQALVQLDECLRSGPDRVYLYFKLRHLDGLSPHEISQATGWSLKATYKLQQTLKSAVEACANRLDLVAP